MYKPTLHWTDLVRDSRTDTGKVEVYASAIRKLCEALMTDGWTSEEIAFFASEEFAVKREIFRDAILRVHAKDTKGETHEV